MLQNLQTVLFLQNSFGKHGIHSVYMPKIDNFECIALQRAAHHIREQISWGEAYVTGMSIKKKRRCKAVAAPCPVIKIQPVSSVGDVVFDPSPQEIRNVGFLIPKQVA